MAVIDTRESRPSASEADPVTPWDLAAIDQAVIDLDLNRMVELLEAGIHRGRPGAPLAIKRVAVERLLLRHARARKRRFRIAMALTNRPEPVARQVGCPILAGFWPEEAEAVGERWLALAEDEDWEVREWAAGLGATLLAEDYEAVHHKFQEWIGGGSPWVARAVAVAARGACDRRRPERVDGLLDLLQQVIDQEDMIVRKVLGTYVLGDGFMRVAPRPTLTRLRLWSKHKSWAARWTVAMAFTVAAARRHARRGLLILSSIPRAEAIVARAVDRARDNLQELP